MRAVDNAFMDVSVVIPTNGRPGKLAACLRSLSRQSPGAGRYEVLVGLDGPDTTAEVAAREAWGRRDGLAVVACPRAGYNAARNRLLGIARGRILLSLNDDVVADANLIERHLAAHAEPRDRPAIIVGSAPWRVHADDTLFDRLVRETGLIFFYDAMNTPEGLRDRGRDWGFRHCFGLNFSAPTEAVRAVGGFTAFPLAYGYDDVELAFRLRGEYGCPVLYRPEASVEHDHRYGPAEVLERETKLGRSAWHFAEERPAFARALFGRDIREELGYSREYVARERAGAERAERAFAELARAPASALPADVPRAVLEALSQQWVPAKRWRWRAGLVEASQAVDTTVSRAA